MIPTSAPSPVEYHGVFVTLADGSKHRVCDWTTWAEAIALWTALDDQRRDAIRAKGMVAFKDQPIKHYEVRSATDPAYADLKTLDLERGFRVLTQTYTTEQAAAKAVLKPLGYYAKEGGWVYYTDQRNEERVLTQGWWQSAAATGHHVTRLPGERAYRGTVTTSLQVRVQVGA